jgi:signal transduction histidine kinase
MVIKEINTRLRLFFNETAYLGINETTPLLEKQRIRLINIIMFFAILMELALVLQAVVRGEWIATSVGALLMFINCLPLYFNFIGRINISVWIFCLYSPLSLAALIILFGKEVSNEYSFLIFAIHLIIFLKKPLERILYSIYLLLTIGATYYYIANFSSPLAREFNFFEKNALYIVVAAFIILILKTYTDLVDETLYKVKVLLDEQKEINEELNENKTTIERQNKELQLANEELEKFAYIASHDLKSPLRNVNSFLTLIERKIKQGRTDIHEDIQYATRASKQMYHLIEDILRFSRMKKQEMSFKKVAVNDIIMEVVLSLEEVIKAKSGEVTLELLPEIDCNESQIGLLFQNLIENALKYNDSPKPII